MTTLSLISLLLSVAAIGQVSTETNIGGKRLDLILDISYHPDANKRINIYTHNLAAFHHNKDVVDFFTFNKVSYTFKPGIGVSANLVGNFYKYYPSIGIHFDKKINRISVFFLTSYAFQATTTTENFLIVTYKYPVKKNVNFFSQNEFYTSFRKWSHDLSIERLKAGIELHKTRIGIFYESIQHGGKFDLRTINFGGSLKQTF